MKLSLLLNEDVVSKMYDNASAHAAQSAVKSTTVSIIDFDTIQHQPVFIENIDYPLYYNRAAQAWICRCSNFTLCKRKYQDRSTKPDCSACALRKGC